MHYMKGIVPTLALVASIDALAIRGNDAESAEVAEAEAGAGAEAECTCAEKEAAAAEGGDGAEEAEKAAAAEGAAADDAAGEEDAEEEDAAAEEEDAAAGEEDAAAGEEDAAAGEEDAAAGEEEAAAEEEDAAAEEEDAAAGEEDAAAKEEDAAAEEEDAAAEEEDAAAEEEDAAAEEEDAAAEEEDAAADGAARAVYFMTNQDENAIMVMPVEEDGTLGDGAAVSTGGQGGVMIDMETGEEVATDALASQSAIRVSGDNLFAVNAGSNSLTMMAIDPEDPEQLTMVGEPVETGGDFPTSVAVSDDLSMVCVAHNGEAAGVTCATFDAEEGIGEFDELRPFDLQQSNPPLGPLNGIGMTFFNEDSSMLLTTVKGNPEDESGEFPGFMSMFTVEEGVVGTEDEQVTPEGSAVLFGTALIPGSNSILTTDASFGSATLNLDDPTAFEAQTELEEQEATCWAAISELTGTGFVTDVGVNRLTEVDPATGDVLGETDGENDNPGMIDLQVAGDKVYVLAPGNGTTPCAVTVFDISGGSGTAAEVQNLEVADADNRAMGMAFHP